jgi:hypothetical protein
VIEDDDGWECALSKTITCRRNEDHHRDGRRAMIVTPLVPQGYAPLHAMPLRVSLAKTITSQTCCHDFSRIARDCVVRSAQSCTALHVRPKRVRLSKTIHANLTPRRFARYEGLSFVPRKLHHSMPCLCESPFVKNHLRKRDATMVRTLPGLRSHNSRLYCFVKMKGYSPASSWTRFQQRGSLSCSYS